MVGRADPVALSPLALVRRLARDGLGVRERDPPDAQRRAIDAAVGRVLRGDAATPTAQFLMELVGAPVDAPCAALAAARGDGALMGEWIQRTLLAWLGADVAADV